nr:putative ankyrin repeat protein [Biomphalaria glabrata]
MYNLFSEDVVGFTFYAYRTPNNAVNQVLDEARSRDPNIDKEEIDSRNSNGNTALMLAVEKRDLGTCQFLHEHGANPNVLRSKEGDCTALSLAHKLYNTEFIRLLIRHGALFSCSEGLEALGRAVSCSMYEEIIAGENKRSQTETEEKFETALIVANHHGRDDLVTKLIQNKVSLGLTILHTRSPDLLKKLISAGVDINFTDTYGRTALHKAALFGRFDIVQLLVEGKAHLDPVDLDGNIPLLLSIPTSNVIITKGCCLLLRSVDKTNYKQIISYLIEKNCNINCSNSKGETPLFKLVKSGFLEQIKEVIAKGADINFVTSSGDNALHLAIKENKIEIVECLKENKVDVNILTSNGVSPLMLALQIGNDYVANLLINAGADVNCKDDLGQSALIKAISGIYKWASCESEKQNYIKIAEALIKAGAEVNCTDSIPALVLCLENENFDLVKLLIDRGCNVNVRNKKMLTALMLAVDKNQKDIVERLLQAGAYVNDTDSEGNTALMRAVVKETKYYQTRHYQVTVPVQKYLEDSDALSTVHLLLKYNAGVNVFNKYKESALTIAMRRPTGDVAQLLVQNGADVNIYTSPCEAPLLIAAAKFDCAVVQEIMNSVKEVDLVDKNGNTALMIFLKHSRGNWKADECFRLVSVFVERNAKIDHVNHQKESPLLLAVKRNDSEIVKYLLHHGANANHFDGDGNPVLFSAVKINNEDIVAMLIDHGADVRALGYRARTALVVSLLSHEPKSFPFENVTEEGPLFKIIRLLVESGADVNTRSEDNETPILLAAYLNQLAVVKYLLGKGADANDEGLCQSLISSFKKTEKSKEREVKQFSNNSMQTPPSLHSYSTSYMPTILEQKIIYLSPKRNHTPLQVALIMEHEEMVYFLLETGADIYVRDSQGNEALHYAASCANKKILGYFVNKFHADDAGHCKSIKKMKLNFNLDTRNQRNETALFIAAKCNRQSNVKILIKAGSDLNAKSCSGQTPLALALFCGFDEIALLLMQHGSDLNNINKHCNNAFQLSVQHRCLLSFHWLMAAGINIFERNHVGGTVLHYSTTVEIAKPLLAAGLPINGRDRFGRSPLHVAVLNGNVDLAIYLLDNGAMPNLDLQDNLGRTALMFLAGNLRWEFRKLTSSGADVNIKDKQKRSALIYFLMTKSAIKDFYKFIYFSLPCREDTSFRVRSQTNLDLCLDTKYKYLLEQFAYSKKLDQTNAPLSIETLSLFLCNSFAYNLEECYFKHCNVETFLKNGHLGAIRILIATCYLSNKDLRTILSYNRNTYGFVSHDMHSLLTEASQNPWPLAKLAFVAVSSQLGDSPEREKHLEQSFIPETIQEMFKFQTKLARLPVNLWESIPLCFDPTQYEQRPIPRPLLYYWPIGENFVKTQMAND